jgi:hypothetical protein
VIVDGVSIVRPGAKVEAKTGAISPAADQTQS